MCMPKYLTSIHISIDACVSEGKLHCSFVCSAISVQAVFQLHQGRAEEGALLSAFAILFCALDYMWTPWQKYSTWLTAWWSCLMSCQLGRIAPRC